MSIKIDCPKCGGSGIVPRYNLDTDSFSNIPCPNANCHKGKIAVYTQNDLEEVRDLKEQIAYLRGDVINLQGKADSREKALKTLSDLIKEEYDDDKKMFGYLYRKSVKIKEALNNQ